jgi:hypothetical protein
MYMKYLCTLENIKNNDFITKMSGIYNLDERLVSLLYSRGINTQEKLGKFLSPSLTDLYDPFLFENMQSVERVHNGSVTVATLGEDETWRIRVRGYVKNALDEEARA